MKRKIFTIILLLSFLVVLSHPMISHHHHESVSLVMSIVSDQPDEITHHSHGYGHHHSPNGKSEQKQSEQESNHNHTFPLHQHFSATNDYDYTRANLVESNPQHQTNASFYVIESFRWNFSKHSNIAVKRHIVTDFFIPSQFVSAANSLRGPPSIA